MATLHRKRKSEKRYKDYREHLKPGECNFCTFNQATKQVITGTEFFWVVRNIFAYDWWDDSRVEDHLMIVPKRHVHWLAEFTEAESKEYIGLLQKYEKRGYNLYARTHDSKAKSVAHQHTHLIKTSNKNVRFVLYAQKPRIAFYK